MEEPTSPPDPDNFLQLIAAAQGMYQLFLTLLDGGFNERQAIILIAEFLRPREMK